MLSIVVLSHFGLNEIWRHFPSIWAICFGSNNSEISLKLVWLFRNQWNIPQWYLYLQYDAIFMQITKTNFSKSFLPQWKSILSLFQSFVFLRKTVFFSSQKPYKIFCSMNDFNLFHYSYLNRSNRKFARIELVWACISSWLIQIALAILIEAQFLWTNFNYIFLCICCSQI